MSLFAEGIRSSLLPCSYSILLLGLALVVLRKKERIAALGVFSGATVFSAWIRAAGISDLVAGRVVSTVMVIGGLALALLVKHRLAGLGAAGLIGVFAGATWLPCVGERLGAVLILAQDAPVSVLPRLTVYLIGVMLPIVAVVALLAYFPAARRWADNRWVLLGAKASLAAVGVLVLTGTYPTLLSTLARWSVL